MANVLSAIQDTIPISKFNKGMAGQIFDLVSKDGPKVVIKNNTPACVLLSPEDYVKLMDELEDAKLAVLAAERLQEPGQPIPEADVWEHLGVSKEDILKTEDVEIE